MTSASGELGLGAGIGPEACPWSENQQEWPLGWANGAEIPKQPSLAPSSFMEPRISLEPGNGVGKGGWDHYQQGPVKAEGPGKGQKWQGPVWALPSLGCWALCYVPTS